MFKFTERIKQPKATNKKLKTKWKTQALENFFMHTKEI